ncbi:MAG: Na+/H+ antiporter subunit E [Coriobacteriia bacterium]|nr:Na+/H+ antiporter subunit E [Coriobacteriia bacterium]
MKRATNIGQAMVLLAGFWAVLAGLTSPGLVAVGLPVAAAVAAWAGLRLWTDDEPPVMSARQWLRFAGYCVRLVRDIVSAAVLVAEKVLDPRMPIDPVLIVHRARFGREVSRVALANSITLTPGTLTVDVDGDRFVVHCLAEGFADDIRDGTFERRIRRVFEEP